jgi:ketosteroid isomerase-like protein
MRQTRSFWFALLLLCAAGAVAKPPADGERALLAADATRTAAMLAGDTAALERLLADDLSYGHSSGQVQGKKDFIEDLRSGARKYRALAVQDSAARVYGCAGVVTAKAAIEVESEGRPFSFAMRYTATYAHQYGRWLLVAYQSVKLP